MSAALEHKAAADQGDGGETRTKPAYPPARPQSSAPSETLSLGEKIARARARRLGQCPASARPLLSRCYSQKASPRQAIKAFCHECCGYDRAAIAGCSGYACPLWHLRPYQKRTS
jgi:hypothetical protein